MIRKICLLTAVFFYSISIFSQELEVQQDLDLYLLIGQSNMAGRAPFDGKSISNKKILSLNKENKWVVAKDPLHFDKDLAAIGPGLSFAIEMLKYNPHTTIGLIPCAVGGTSISKWQPGTIDSVTMTRPYDEAIRRTKLAIKSGKLKGVLWHQGEGDSNQKAYTGYEERFERLLLNLSKDLEYDSNTMPIVIGEIGIFFTQKEPRNKGSEINKALRKIAKKHKNIECVKSKNLKDKGDATHFDTPSARELGKRYAKAFIKASKTIEKK